MKKKILDENQLEAKKRVETHVKTTGQRLCVGKNTYFMMRRELGLPWVKKYLLQDIGPVVIEGEVTE